ncbi:hypothetical protein FDC26_14195 [Clostridium botulinum]|uniref:hypothetical protein n=1 Tax=unclassified Clostridium TaxID=2614128 RepID=UPI0013CA598A|nr:MULTISPECIES: hypothetical protein [unclassified Clostridium]NFM11392.1 hypothetical protein [Clostridium botulinum]NFN78000.1 hypothetical protein [Clostridium botulinum]NFO75054.1 hypothetical protein [Clostridium botulinum]NFO78810.1 hypothetical protein [Clostridium botulinum]NFP05732.1 hypothetical protein [Clostridium botulinum]
MFDPVSYNINAQQEEWRRQAEESLNEKFRKEEEYKNNVLNTLINIERNTDNISNLVELIRNSNDKQDQIIDIINELLLLSKETNRDIAVSKYQKVMNKINGFANNVDSYNKLMTFGTTIYTLLHSNGII